jgi:exonuclease SbcC
MIDYHNMIPQKLTITGFLSYRDKVEIDFNTFDLACISGANGAGKSSILDALTWVLFGKGRSDKDSDALVNSHADITTASVSLVFEYEGNLYNVQRARPRGKTSTLEFQIKNANGEWKALTERSIKETQKRIEQILHMDYDIFTNASFFLQGKADQFTQQTATKRKSILGSVLGLDIWEEYRQRVFDKRKEIENEMTNIDGRLMEINAELAEGDERRARLKSLQEELSRFSATRAAQETGLAAIRQIAATLEQQRKMVNYQASRLEADVKQLNELEARESSCHKELENNAGLIAHDQEIRSGYANWQKARAELQKWDEIAAQFQVQEKRRQEPLLAIGSERARLEQEMRTLLKQRNQINEYEKMIPELQVQLSNAQKAGQEAQSRIERRTQCQQELDSQRQIVATLTAENKLLWDRMAELNKRLATVTAISEAECPVCGQPMQDKEQLMNEITAKGSEIGDIFRANQKILAEQNERAAILEKEIAVLSRAEEDLRSQTRQVDQINDRLMQIVQIQRDWQVTGEQRLTEISRSLEQENYALEARQRLAEVDCDLTAIGYDAATHDRIRRNEIQGRESETALRNLEKALTAREHLEAEYQDIRRQIDSRRQQVEQQQKEYDQAAVSLAAAQAQAPNLNQAEKDLMASREKENQLRMLVGAAQQKVSVLDDLRIRHAALETEREDLAHMIERYKKLERAFGKNGIPALLIEQALPQIEVKANDILNALSESSMSVRFRTQKEYKDKNRSDLQETLDIVIRDEAGSRDYEMYSGGEAFRVNFAIRLALSEVLAQRAGARLQTLVIDEGFGSQDALGRQRLVEAINHVQEHFSKILVITHIDEIKDLFPVHIEVEKTARGSVINIV